MRTFEVVGLKNDIPIDTDPPIALLILLKLAIILRREPFQVQEQFDEEKLREAHLQKQRWQKWQMEFLESQNRAREFKAYWERRHQDDTDLWRDKDFADAVFKMSRAGYKGEYGHHEVPEEDKIYMEALHKQVTCGDYEGNDSLECADEWKKLIGKSKIDAQREYIHHANKMLTRYGWNPPDD